MEDKEKKIVAPPIWCLNCRRPFELPQMFLTGNIDVEGNKGRVKITCPLCKVGHAKYKPIKKVEETGTT